MHKAILYELFFLEDFEEGLVGAPLPPIPAATAKGLGIGEAASVNGLGIGAAGSFSDVKLSEATGEDAEFPVVDLLTVACTDADCAVPLPLLLPPVEAVVVVAADVAIAALFAAR